LVGFFFILGTIIGSFLNVVILRSLSGESLVYPPSHCAQCQHHLAPWDLIPVLSYIILKGKCRYCGSKISIQYPLIELVTGIVFVLLYLKYGLTVELAQMLVFASILIIITMTDIKAMTASHIIALVGFAIVLILKIIAGEDILIAFLPAIILFILFAIGCYFGGIGDGDVSLAALIGLALGMLSMAAVFIAIVIGGIYGIILIIQNKANSKKQIPLVPFLTAGCMLAIMLEPQINAYISSFYCFF
jgi:leader peptidase (prepilin peptidase)/N-methyltransferase